MTEKPIIFSTEMVRAILAGRKTQTRRVCKEKVDDYKTYLLKPKYQPGDHLWVRETWCKDANGDYVYRTNYGTTEDDSFPPSMFKWRPSIHMPREAARIFLLIKSVRLERLQDITEDDAEAEGAIDWICQQHNNGTWIDNAMRGAACAKPKRAFALLWNSIYEKRGFGWDQNPWVWVIEFERVKP